MKKVQVLIGLVSIMISCSYGADNSARVKVHFWNPVSMKTVSAKDQFTGTPPADAKQVVITAYEGSINSNNLIFNKTYSKLISVASFDIEAGNSRIFRVEALDAEGRISYRGTSGEVDLKSGDKADVVISMVQIPVATTTININLLKSDGVTPFDLTIESSLLNNEINLHVFTLNSSVFEDTTTSALNIPCSESGDYLTTTYSTLTTPAISGASNNIIDGISIPANSFVAVVLKGYYSGLIGTTPTPTYLRYLGMANTSETSNLPEGVISEINVKLYDGLFSAADLGTTPDETVDLHWKPYNKCTSK